MENNIPYGLLAAFFSSPSDEDISQKVQNWLDANPQNAEVMDDLKSIWEYINRLQYLEAVNADKIWKGIHDNIEDV